MFNIVRCRGATLRGICVHMYSCRQHTATPGPANPTTLKQDTHIARTRALPLPSAQPHASVRETVVLSCAYYALNSATRLKSKRHPPETFTVVLKRHLLQDVANIPALAHQVTEIMPLQREGY